MGLVNEGLGIRSRREEEYLPILPILDTEEVLEKVGQEWRVPEPFGRYKSSSDLFASHDKEIFQKKCDHLFLQWVIFLDSAAEGRQIGIDTAQEGKISIDLPKIGAYMSFYRAMGPGGNYSETIPSIRAAFAMLLSPEARETVDGEMKDVRVDRELRNQINTLFKGVARQLGVIVGTPLK